MNSFARLVSGRRSKFAVLALWLAALAAMGPLIGQFESKQKNEPSSFLPAGAESVRALALSEQLPIRRRRCSYRRTIRVRRA